MGGYARYIRSRFILEKYGNPYQNPTASIKSYWELGSRVPPQFPGLRYSVKPYLPICKELVKTFLVSGGRWLVVGDV